MDLDVASIITAAGGAVALILRALSTRRSRTSDLEDRVAELEAALLGWAQWAHTARMTAAASGCRLPAVPRPRNGTDAPHREAQPDGR